MIVLGGLLKIKPMVTLDSVLRGLKKTLPERHHHLIPMNEEAIKKRNGTYSGNEMKGCVKPLPHKRRNFTPE